MPLDRIAITGSSGAHGRGLINIRAPHCNQPDEFYQCDITKDDMLAKLVASSPIP